MVNKRRDAIVDLIQSKAIGSLEELMHELSKLGFIVSQATVSHDIRDLGIVKKKVGFGYQYELGTVTPPQVDNFEERSSKKGNSRRDAILDIIQSKSIGSQDELVQELSKLGFLVTQATISRDIKDLGLVKSRTGTGFRYIAKIKETSSRDDYSVQARISQSTSSDSISLFETESEMRARIEAELRTKIEAEIRAKMSAGTADVGSEEKQPRYTDTPVKQRFNRPYVFDQRLSASLDRAFNKLEAYFPEGKVFALDSIDGELRETLASLYKRAGYETVDDMFSAYGFERISGEEVKELRSYVMYTPGNEPDIIKNKVDNAIKLLEEYYPSHVIPRGIQSDHKNLSGKISGLYQWLGYDSQKSFLAAYGYEYSAGEIGRPSQDYQAIIDILVGKYKDKPKPNSMGELIFDNPDLKGPIKSLQNKSSELFGMSLKQYFDEIGLLRSRVTRIYGTSRTARAPIPCIEDGVSDSLSSLYSKLDSSKFGTAEGALECLKGMRVNQNKAGQNYIFRAIDCDSKVTIPYGISSISDGCFMDQSGIEEVIIHALMTEIPRKAFANCSALVSITIPEGVTSIGQNAFANCSSLQSITFPKSLQQISSEAFVNCSSLTNVVFLNPLTIVSDDAFDGSSYTYIPPDGKEATDSSCFKYIVDRKGNASIFGFVGDMETVVVPSMIEGHPIMTIAKGAFQGCKHLVDVTMPDHITTLQGDAFRDCISLKRIHLSNGISKIITTTFAGCIGLKEINIPDGVAEVKRGTFKDSPLEKLHIGKALASIDSKLFNNGEVDQFSGKQKTTRAINTVSVDPDNPYLKATDSMVLSKDGKILFASLGNRRSVSIPDGVEVIGNNAFDGLVFLSDVYLPDSLVSIGERAFHRTGLRSVSLGARVKRIAAGAFKQCSNLTAAMFNDGIQEIGDEAFLDCPIVSVLLPASLCILGSASFDCLGGGYYAGNGSGQRFEIDTANPYLKADGDALYSLSENGKTLQSLYGQKYHQFIIDNRQKALEYIVENGTTSISPAACARCTSLAKVILPEGLLSIGANAFIECSHLKEISLPSTIEEIGENAFKGTEIKDFTLGAFVRDIGLEAFITGNEWEDKRTKLRKIKVDKNNQTFFVSNKSLMKRKQDGTTAVMVYFGGEEIVALPDGVSEICSGAFKRSIVQEIQIPSTVTVIGEQAFARCSKLSRLRVGFSEPENGASYAVVYIPEVKTDQFGYGDTRIRDQYMDCIRVDGSGTVFDFIKYDSLFDTIATSKDSILVATDRLKSAIQLAPLYRNKYLSYLRKNAKQAVEIVVEFDDLTGLNTLAELGVFTGKNIDAIIELANKAKKAEILSYLMNYKHTNIGITEQDYDL